MLAFVKYLPPFIALVLLVPIGMSITTLWNPTEPAVTVIPVGPEGAALQPQDAILDLPPTIHLVSDGIRQEITDHATVSATRNSSLELYISGEAGLAELPIIIGSQGVRLGPSRPTNDGSYRRPLKVTFEGDAELTIATVNRLGTHNERVITFQQTPDSKHAQWPRPAVTVK
jgi:hypothetical protein